MVSLTRSPFGAGSLTLKQRYPQPWRQALVPAKYKGAEFFMEACAFVSGRRIALHEYPKKDTPYAEDMGRRTRRFSIIGYLVGPNYTVPRDQLKLVLEQESAGQLQVQQATQDLWRMNVKPEEFTIAETREKGGYCVFDMRFIEAGQAASTVQSINTTAAVNNNVDNLNQTASQAFGDQPAFSQTTPFVPGTPISPPPTVGGSR